MEAMKFDDANSSTIMVKVNNAATFSSQISSPNVLLSNVSSSGPNHKSHTSVNKTFDQDDENSQNEANVTAGLDQSGYYNEMLAGQKDRADSFSLAFDQFAGKESFSIKGLPANMLEQGQADEES